MSNLQTVIVWGVVAWVALVWLILKFVSIARHGADQELEDMEQIAQVSQPAALEPERPHVRAGGVRQ